MTEPSVAEAVLAVQSDEDLLWMVPLLRWTSEGHGALADQELASLVDATAAHMAATPGDYPIRSLHRKAQEAYDRYAKRRYGDE